MHKSKSSNKSLIFALIFSFISLISINLVYYNSNKLASVNWELDNIGRKIIELEQINADQRTKLEAKEKIEIGQKIGENNKINAVKPIDPNRPVEITRTSGLLKSNFNYTGLRTSIWQTAPAKVEEKIEKLMGSWKKVPGWTYNFISNAAIKDYLQSVFPKLDVAKIFEEHSILAYDLFRYTIIYQNGGMYADSDVNKADQFQDSMTNLRDCNVIVGIEGDLRTEPEWIYRLPRSLQICQWSFYAKERHPMVKYAMDRIVDKIWWLQQKKKNLHDQDVMEVTGPGIWTDAVIDYIKVSAGVDIKEYMKCGQSYKFKDICVLNVKAFASTMPHSTCKSETNENSYIINMHHFLGSWRNN